jgi:hypothetical protein
MFSTPPQTTQMHPAGNGGLDPLAAAVQPAGVPYFRSVVVTCRSLLAGLAVVSGLAIPWNGAQLAGAATPPPATASATRTTPIATPPKGHTGVIVPPAGDPARVNHCPAKTSAVTRADDTISRPTTPIATPPEGHTGIVGAPAS